ncbi:hypothetical protein BDW02DRAFT_637018 [Decorospora gaudefroyi]|uniref:F-box domain-containing protein n=1 Tax=Decorospora gaudefroyi TaxID=184978 RepID=A0A6A5KHA3_9PLEO|nr:hypothetical protein BDW02DRAFT_637018 [Decorospora gaudefroyi]
MSFVGSFSDLFTCGRARRPARRETQTEPYGAPTTDEPASGPITTANEEVSTTRAHHHVCAPTPGEADCGAESVQRAPRDSEECGHSSGRNKDGGRALVQENKKAKSSGGGSGWMVEQTVLVTAVPPPTTTDVTALPEPQSQPEMDEVAPPVRCAEPEPDALENGPVVLAATEPATRDDGVSVVSESSESKPEVPALGSDVEEPPQPKLEEREFPVFESDVEEVAPNALEDTPVVLASAVSETREDDASIVSETPESRPEEPESAARDSDVQEAAPQQSSVAVEEATVTALEAEMKADDVPATQKTAPVRLLDLPPEIRNRIYDRMSEQEPIRMCRSDDPALTSNDEIETPRVSRRQFYNLTQVCHKIRQEFLPIYAAKTEYIIDLWAQKANLSKVDALKGHVSMDIDAACFDMEPIDLLPLIRCLARTHRTDHRFASTEGVVFQSIQAIVDQLNKLLPGPDARNKPWLEAVNGPMKRIDLHLFPHEDVRSYYRFRGAEPLLRVVYPAAVSADWMKRSSKSDGYEAYLCKTGLDALDMHIVIGHASRRTTNEGRLPLDWRMSLQLSRLSVDRAPRLSVDRSPRMSMDVVAARMSMTMSR